jgi:hypothetical protein
MVQYFSPEAQQQLLLSISKKNNNKPVLKYVQLHEISFSTSAPARISVVDVSNNIKTSCALHVITNNGAIFFARSTATVITQHIKKQQ